MKTTMSVYTPLFLSLVTVAGIGCSGVSALRTDEMITKQESALPTQGGTLKSGTIILSHPFPTEGFVLASHHGQVPAPLQMMGLVGYLPPFKNLLPADNEIWLEVIKSSMTLILRQGKDKIIKEVRGEGNVGLEPGEYTLSVKKKSPIWYAPDEYFQKRHLSIPQAGDKLRYRRGALGEYVLYPTPGFAIHCASVWTEEVGGLRISREELSSIYPMLPVGTSIVVNN